FANQYDHEVQQLKQEWNELAEEIRLAYERSPDLETFFQNADQNGLHTHYNELRERTHKAFSEKVKPIEGFIHSYGNIKRKLPITTETMRLSSDEPDLGFLSIMKNLHVAFQNSPTSDFETLSVGAGIFFAFFGAMVWEKSHSISNTLMALGAIGIFLPFF